MKKAIITLGILILIAFGIHMHDEYKMANTYNIRIYSNDVTIGASAYINDSIYTEEFWELYVNAYSETDAETYLSFADQLDWAGDIQVPERQADEVLSVSKGGLGYISWKVWLDDDSGTAILFSSPERVTKIALEEYKNLPFSIQEF